MEESGYYFGFPHRSEAYPNSQKESFLVLEKMKNPDMEFFNMSDISPKQPFMNYLKENNLEFSENNLSQIIFESLPFLMENKRFHNRPRPTQVNANITPIQSQTAATPSYPAGHTFQSYLIAHHLSLKHPKHRDEFFQIAKRIADARVSVGLHYPSDNEGGIALANRYLNLC